MTLLDTDTWDKVFERYKETWSWYEQWVSKNPTTVAQIENTFRILSYMVAGCFEESQVMSELIFAASNLLVLFHDNIFRKTLEVLKVKICLSKAKLMQWLTVISYLEVFFELAASRAGGQLTRWTMILLTQIIKAVLRLILLLKFRYGIQKPIPVVPVKRESIEVDSENENRVDDDGKISGRSSAKLNNEDLDQLAEKNKVTDDVFKGRRSGRTIRTLKSAPALNQRTWKLHEDHISVTKESLEPAILSKQRLFAEGIHIIRPLVHLSSMFCFGINSWAPWLLSLSLDLSSLHLIGETDDLNIEEKSEVKRRTVMLLIYLLRSPFFDNYSKMKIIGILKNISHRFPAFSLVLDPLVEYLPHWQKIYFYNWAV